MRKKERDTKNLKKCAECGNYMGVTRDLKPICHCGSRKEVKK